MFRQKRCSVFSPTTQKVRQNFTQIVAFYRRSDTMRRFSWFLYEKGVVTFLASVGV
jgi:hypothetical protein